MLSWLLGPRLFSLSRIACLVGFSTIGCAASPATTFYVSPLGNDAWGGRHAIRQGRGVNGPFKSIERARDAIRELKSVRRSEELKFAVCFRGGDYPLTKTVEFTVEDGGSPAAPIVYRAYRNERVRFTGGIPIAGWKPIQDPGAMNRLNDAVRPHIVQSDLHAQGITNFGQLFERSGALLELFFNGQPMQIARWPNSSSPNQGWYRVGWVPEEGSGDRFIYTGGRPSRWAQSEDVWLHGYWLHEWWDRYAKVKSIDAEQAILITAQPDLVRLKPPDITTGKRINREHSSVGRRFYALNILEELDEAGEWYLDRKSGVLYFWPPNDAAALLARTAGTGSELGREPAGNRSQRSGATPQVTRLGLPSHEDHRAFVSLLETPMITLRDASHVTFQGITFEHGRSNAIEISGGRGVRIAGCRIGNLGGKGVVIDGGHDHAVLSCDLYHLGDGGIVLRGGDLASLTPGGHSVDNCVITDFSRINRTYRPAVDLAGIGHRVAHCDIHTAPHTAILLGGNDHVIEFNDVHHVAQETDDVGALYAGYDMTARGHIIRFNHFHDILGIQLKAPARAVYLDDFRAGTLVFGNYFENTFGVKLGGGRDNVVANNVFVNCEPAMQLDARGLTWASRNWEPSFFRDYMLTKLEALNYRQPPWSRHYPELLELTPTEGPIPRGSKITRNIFFGGKKWLDISAEVEPGWIDIHDNWQEGDPGFLEREDLREADTHWDHERGRGVRLRARADRQVGPTRFMSGGGNGFRVLNRSAADRIGFQRIPAEQIGVQPDEFRTGKAPALRR